MILTAIAKTPATPSLPALTCAPAMALGGRGWPALCCAAWAVRGMRAKSSYTRCCCTVSCRGRGRSASGSAPTDMRGRESSALLGLGG
jgi:hypothetical protein